MLLPNKDFFCNDDRYSFIIIIMINENKNTCILQRLFKKKIRTLKKNPKWFKFCTKKIREKYQMQYNDTSLSS